MSKKNKNNYKLFNNRNNKRNNKNKVEKSTEAGLKVYTDGITERNTIFEELCLMTQYQLKDHMIDYLANYGKVSFGDGYVYLQGTFPVLLVAHMDTVHKELPKEIIYANGTISSPQGIGADDRCGVYMVKQLLERGVKCSVLLTEDEEIGCKGADKFTKTELAKTLKGKFNYLIQMDRRHATDAVFYECDNPEFTSFITQEFFKEQDGSYTDICELSPVLEAASVNFSCGYYNEHHKEEHCNLQEMYTVIDEVYKLLERTNPETDNFEYIERQYKGYGGYGGYSSFGWYDYYDSKGYSRYSSEDGELYYITYDTADENDIGFDEVYAFSEEEAIGKFLMYHPYMCFSEIEEILLAEEVDNSELY